MNRPKPPRSSKNARRSDAAPSSARRKPAANLGWRLAGPIVLLAAVLGVFAVNSPQAAAFLAAAEDVAVTSGSADGGGSDGADRAESPAAPARASSAASSEEPTRRAATPTASGAKELIATTNLLRIMRDGGILMYPIVFCSLVTLAVVFERLVSLRRSRIIPKPFVTRFVKQIRDGELDRTQALALCEENGSPVARIFAGAVRKWGRPAVEVEQAILDAGERVTNDLRRYLRVFSAVSTISPLFGLLGTVFGMIQAFNAVAASDALGRPELLANGVGNALLTTAAGLVVAIPALSMYYLFVGRIDRLVIDLDALGEEVVHAISAEETQEREDQPKTLRVKRTLPARKEAA